MPFGAKPSGPIPEEAWSSDVPVKEMAAVKHVVETGYQYGMREEPIWVAGVEYIQLLPMHVCWMVTKQGERHVFIWE